MDNIPLLLVSLGVSLLNLSLALIILGGATRVWLRYHRKSMGLAGLIFLLGLAAFAIAQTLEFRRLLLAPADLGLSSLEVAARFAFGCVGFLWVWRSFNEAQKIKQQSLEQAETTIQLMRLQADASEHGRKIDLLHKIAQQLTQVSELQPSLEAFCRYTGEAMKATHVSVRLLQPGSNTLNLVASAESSARLHPDRPAEPAPPSRPISGKLARHETSGGPTPFSSRIEGHLAKVIWMGKPLSVDIPSPVTPDSDASLVTLAAFPLIRGKNIIGVLAFAYETSHTFSPDEQRLLTILADYASIAVTQAQLAEQAALHARLDPLTGLANRQHFNESLNAETRRAIRYKTPLSIIMLELAGLRDINVQFGYPAGDAYLIFLAKYVRKYSRDSDLVARLGGNTFATIMTNTSPAGTRRAVERFRSILQKLTFEWEKHLLPINVSIGFAGWEAGEATQADALLAAADQSLHADKSNMLRNPNRIVPKP